MAGKDGGKIEKKKNAIYLRLSIEDNALRTKEKALWLEEAKEKKDDFTKESFVQNQSDSIENQRKMLFEYISKDMELAEQETEEFCDDGFSGVNMERPGIKKLLKQVKQGKIDCILVKDLSRFSRDYIELGTYLNQIFPFMGVRFIAVNDHYDSRKHRGSTIGVDTAFQTLLYDLYSKDISVKVKSAIKSKCEKGEYVFGQVPFGYEKSKEKKNTVIIKESEAKIVRRIFSMAEDGMSSVQIAKKFYKENIPTPSQMRFPKRALKEHYFWSDQTIRKILNNRFYLGEMAYGKTMRRFVGGKEKILLPKKEWNIIANHHKALVSPEVFARASLFRQEQSTKRKYKKHPLTGKIYCGGCGYSINYKRQKGKILGYFWCRKHALLQISECCTCFDAAVLEEIILYEIDKELTCQEDLIKLKEVLEKFQAEQLQKIKEKKKIYKKEYSKQKKEQMELYKNYALGRIGEAEYRNKSDNKELQIQKLLCKIKELEEKYRCTEEEYCSQKTTGKEIIKCLGLEQLTQQAADILIEKVTLYQGKKVEIQWKFGEADKKIT